MGRTVSMFVGITRFRYVLGYQSRLARIAGVVSICFATVVGVWPIGTVSPAHAADPPRRIQRVPKPVTFERSPLSAALVEVSAVVRVEDARQRFGVQGQGLTAAVLDTGVR